MFHVEHKQYVQALISYVPRETFIHSIKKATTS